MNDLLSDLKADLAAPAGPRRTAPPTAPLPPRTTPAFELRVTPLRWAVPQVGFDGGVSLRFGPVQVGLVRR